MIATEIVIEAACRDRNRFKPNPNGAGFLTRAERWSEVVRYCRQRDAQRAAELLENLAIEQAMLCGRDWADCGEYERELFRDEARRILGIDPR
jgi:hypothetical protein